MNITTVLKQPDPPPVEKVILELTPEEARYICYLAQEADVRRLDVTGANASARRLHEKLVQKGCNVMTWAPDKCFL